MTDRCNGNQQNHVSYLAKSSFVLTVMAVASQRTVRPEVMEAFRRSNEKFRDLYRKLAE